MELYKGPFRANAANWDVLIYCLGVVMRLKIPHSLLLLIVYTLMVDVGVFDFKSLLLK